MSLASTQKSVGQQKAWKCLDLVVWSRFPTRKFALSPQTVLAIVTLET